MPLPHEPNYPSRAKKRGPTMADAARIAKEGMERALAGEDHRG